jgi:ABC transporter with metal-binding/Fe-S-binding domain ATP-binding protein
MKIGILYSGGKDSNLVLLKLLEKEEIKVLISIIPKSVESYMFHFPNANLTKLQAKAIGLPIITKTTKAEKEKELEDLKEALKEAKEKFEIEAIASGAIKSKYQKERIDRIAKELNLESIAPLWQISEEEELRQVVESKIKAIITGVFAEELKEFLGKEIEEVYNELLKLKGRINISGEGGEYETFVYDSPIFKKRIKIVEKEKLDFGSYSLLRIKKAVLENKD